MNVLFIIFVAAVALVICVCVRQALLASPFAEHSFVMSIAVTLLCLLGMFRHVGGVHQESGAAAPSGEGLPIMLLLPYAVLGISIIFVVILAALSRFIAPASKRLSRHCERSEGKRLQEPRADSLEDAKSPLRRIG